MSCYAQAVKLLAPRDHFRAELAQKLARRLFDEDEIETTLARLRDEGMIDDRASAARFVRRKLRGEPLGRRRLSAELRRKGVDEHVVEATLDAELPDDERDLASASADRWLARHRPQRAKLARYLERRGFGAADIMSIIARLPPDDGVAS